MSAGQGGGSITNPQNDRRTLTHRGNQVGEENVELLNNVTGEWTPVLKWTGPRKYSRIDYAGGVHPTKAELRTVEEYVATDDDGSAALEEDERTFALSTNIVPISGDYDPVDQPFPTVEAVNVTQGTTIAPEDLKIDYATSEVTVPESEVAIDDTIKFYPVLSDGLIQYRAINQFDHELAALDEWGTALHSFADHDQLKGGSEIHLVGRVSWEENETVAVFVNAPQQVVWEDADYPGTYVSSFQQKVDVSV